MHLAYPSLAVWLACYEQTSHSTYLHVIINLFRPDKLFQAQTLYFKINRPAGHPVSPDALSRDIGADQIPVELLKDATPVVEHLTTLLRKVLKTGEVPWCSKEGSIISLYKAKGLTVSVTCPLLFNPFL